MNFGEGSPGELKHVDARNLVGKYLTKAWLARVRWVPRRGKDRRNERHHTHDSLAALLMTELENGDEFLANAKQQQMK